MRKALHAFTHFFVQDEKSIELLKSIDLNNATLSGDTRFDRVSEILEKDNELIFMEQFKGNEPCFVAGSTWPEDEDIIVQYINRVREQLKFVLAPHNIRPEHIQALKKSILRRVVLYSEMEFCDLAHIEVLIIDTIGLLTKIYSYADMAYVGGAFVTGLHNTLEPAVFGVPILIGPKYKGFNEAEALVNKKGIVVVNNSEEFNIALNRFLQNPEYLRNTGRINADFVKENKGASIQIMAYLRRLL